MPKLFLKTLLILFVATLSLVACNTPEDLPDTERGVLEQICANLIANETILSRERCFLEIDDEFTLLDNIEEMIPDKVDADFVEAAMVGFRPINNPTNCGDSDPCLEYLIRKRTTSSWDEALTFRFDEDGLDHVLFERR